MSITGDQIETEKGAGLQQPALRPCWTEFSASDLAHLGPQFMGCAGSGAVTPPHPGREANFQPHPTAECELESHISRSLFREPGHP